MSESIGSKVREIFSQRLRNGRERAGFKTARAFARALDIDENRYTRYERAEVEPNLHLLMKIAERLDMSPNDLLGYDSNRYDQRTSAYTMPGFAEPHVALDGRNQDTGRGAMTDTGGARGARLGAAARQPGAAWTLAETLARISTANSRGAGQDTLSAVSRAAEYYARITDEPIRFAAELDQIEGLAQAQPEDRDRVAQLVRDVIAGLSMSA